MANKKTIENKLPRVTRSEVYPEVGETAEKLKVIIPVFGEEIVKSIINAVSSGQVRHGEISITSLEQPKQTLKVNFENQTGQNDITLKLEGNWNQISESSLDNPLFSPVKGIVYRKRQPTDELPIAEEGQTIEPGGPICAISQSKNNIWYLQLPIDKFPNGGILTSFVIANGKEVEKGETICYIKKI